MQDEAEMLRKQIQELNTSIRYAAESIEHITSHRKNGTYAEKNNNNIVNQHLPGLVVVS